MVLYGVVSTEICINDTIKTKHFEELSLATLVKYV